MHPLTRSTSRARFFGAAPSLLLDFMAGTMSPLITFTRASSATYFDSAGVLQSAANNVPRFDYNPSTLAAQGLLIEESRTNSIRNNTMVGAVAGTPGTAPTNWSRSASPTSGISNEIVGTGTESGITYIDLRFTGTATATISFNINLETTTQVAASPSQTWAVSTYVKLTAGVLNSATFSFTVGEYSSVPAFLRNNFSSTTTPTSAGLATQRVAYLFTTGASTASIQPQISVNLTNGLTYDFTLRIGLPQLELGAFATSVIPTTTTALTRAADVASVNTLTPWYNQSESSFYAEVNNQVLGTDKRPFWVTDATNTPAYGLRMASNNTFATAAFNSGTFSAIAPGTVTVGIMKQAGAIATNDVAAVANGGAVGTASSWTNFTAAKITLGLDQFGGNVLNGYLRRIVYYPRRLSNAELQSITS
jgi:hypothetical protein